MTRALWIIGFGGHAKVVIEAARLSGVYEVVGCLDDDPGRLGSSILGVPVSGNTTERSLAKLGVRLAVIAVGSNAARRTIAERLDHLLEWATIVHPNAWVSSFARIGAGAAIMAGVIVQPNTVIGEHSILNTSCSIDHDCRIDAYAHISPGAHVTGNVQIEMGAFVGAGATVIPSLVIGAWSVVVAGAAVVRDVPPASTVAGVPARTISRHADP